MVYIDNFCAEEQAMQGNMYPQYTSFGRYLLKSHVLYRVYIDLPKKFCDVHFPSSENNIVTLVDGCEREFRMTYSVRGKSLMHGWRYFVVTNGLKQGDTVFFHLIGQCRFKVLIIREEEKQNHRNKPTLFVERKEPVQENVCTGNTAAQKYPVSYAVNIHQNNGMVCQIKKRVHDEVVPEENMKHLYPKRTHRTTETRDADGDSNLNIRDSPNDAESTSAVRKDRPATNVHEKAMQFFNCDSKPSPEQSDQCGNSESDFDFEDVKSFEDFKIYINGETLDSIIPSDIRRKYYELCCSEKKFLHDHLIKGVHTKLVTAMIHQIVSISNSMKSTSISTSLHHLELMETNLKTYEDLGMAVGSLRHKIVMLIEIAKEHQTAEECTTVRLKEIESERTALQENKAKIDELMEKALAHGESIGHLQAKVYVLEERKEKLYLMFEEIAGSKR